MSSSNLNQRVLRITAALNPGLLARPAEDVQVRAVSEVRPARYGFVDLLRGFAIVLMVETHVMNAYLPIALKKGSTFFFWLSFINGLVAPAFLFAAGFSLVLQGKTQWENWLHFRLPFWKQMRRLGFILLIAYYTHLQGFRVSRYFMHWDDGLMWKRTFQVDVLQCIVVSLLVVHLLILLLRKKELLPWGAGLLAVCIALATPWIWAQDFRGSLPLSLALFLNPHGISLFPVFPWICFVLAGTCIACLFLKSAEGQVIPQFMRNIALLGALMITAGLLLRRVPYTLPGFENFFTTSPLYMMIRIGCVLLILALLYRLETKREWVPKSIQLAGQESLLIYGVHLSIIYGFLRGKRLGPVLGLQSGYLAGFLLSAAIVVLMLLAAKYWHKLKRDYPRRAKIGQVITVLLMMTVFLLG